MIIKVFGLQKSRTGRRKLCRRSNSGLPSLFLRPRCRPPPTRPIKGVVATAVVVVATAAAVVATAAAVVATVAAVVGMLPVVVAISVAAVACGWRHLWRRHTCRRRRRASHRRQTGNIPFGCTA